MSKKSFKDTVTSILQEANVHQPENTNNTSNIKTLKPGSKHKEEFGIDDKNKHGQTGKEFQDLGAATVHPTNNSSLGRAAAAVISKVASRRADTKTQGEPGYRLKEALENLPEDATIEDFMESLDEDTLALVYEMEAEEIADILGEDAVDGIIEYFKENVEIVDEEEDLDEDVDISEEDFIEEMEAVAEEMGIEDINALDEEQLDELSSATLKSYLNKTAPGTKRAKSKRDAGVGRASGKLLARHGKTKDDVGEPRYKRSTTYKHASFTEEELPQVDMKEDVDALFSGESLTEEFKEKATTVFESAVTSKLREYQEFLDAKFEEAINEATDELEESLTEQVEEYLQYVAEKWLEDNEVAIENSIRTEISESFIAGLRNLMIEHSIDIPETDVPVVEQLAKDYDELKAELDEMIQANIDLKNELAETKKMEVFLGLLDDLTETQAEKLAGLVEDVEFTTEEDFINKVETLKESYFHKTVKSPSTLIEENDLDENDTQQVTGPMARYVEALNRTTPR